MGVVVVIDGRACGEAMQVLRREVRKRIELRCAWNRGILAISYVWLLFGVFYRELSCR